jgi:glyoxylase-like metal-dependent hydrolase (beta-lactamase superfamily II)
MRASMNTFALHHLTVFERGWLSSNNILLHGDSDDEGATLVDSGHCVHAEQTVALVRHALPGAQTLRHIVNTHLHSDHCGGNAALQRAFPGVLLSIPPGQADAVSRWDEDALSYRATGQRIERFAHDALLRPGESLTVGTRTWQALAAPGHDPHSLVLFDAHDGVLISADALWGNGFGVVFPELDGEQAFDEVAAARCDRKPRAARRRPRPRRAVHRRRRGAATCAQAAGRVRRRSATARAPRREGAAQIPRDGRARDDTLTTAGVGRCHAAAATPVGATGCSGHRRRRVERTSGA